jgi:hypothetical protein
MKKTTQSSDTLRGYLLTLVVVVAFSIYPTVTPVALASGASPVTFVLLAMVLSLFGTVAVSVLRGERLLPLHSEVSGCVVLGALLFCEHALLAYSLLYLKVPVAMSVVYTYPFMIGIVAVMRGSAPATRSLFVSLVACVVGIALIFGFSVDELSVVGVSFALGQAVLAASRILLAAKLAPGAPGIALTARMLAVGVLLGLFIVPFMPISLPTDTRGIVAIGIAGVSSMVGHTCLMWALQRIGPVPFGVLMNLEPVVAAIFVAVFLGQVLSPVQYAGAALVILAVTWFGIFEKMREVFQTSQSVDI